MMNSKLKGLHLFPQAAKDNGKEGVIFYQQSLNKFFFCHLTFFSSASILFCSSSIFCIIGSMIWTWSKKKSIFLPSCWVILPGTPTIVEFGGTSLTTTAFAPI